ncbi:MAG: CAAD domains of cyanobacterial aminoacyl-tRNA synthetase-domain-containing protein [Monoraphidium minutum]|nr:MAG: CAAD domains of cyanobacterial aminoacyl-tRNA synthetase-domain-containing protein [Monoraphidium minutum]
MQLLARNSVSAGAARRPVQARVPARLSQGVLRRRSVVVRAEEAGADVEKVVKDLSEKWDKVENKTGVLAYAGGAVALLWLSSTIVSAIDHIPLVPKLMELVGLGYTAWFVYRYLLFQSSREELVKDVDDLKKKIGGGSL